MDLVIRRHISREANEYTTNNIAAQVAGMLEASGVHLAAGESIDYIIIDASGTREACKAKPLALYAFEDGYDRDQYAAFLFDAVATLLQPFGYGIERLREELLPPDPRRRARRQRSQQTELFVAPARYAVAARRKRR